MREALILSEASAEVKSYASAGQALLFLLFIPAYGAFASRVNRTRLISWVTLFFVRHALFLPTSREAKYKAKAPIDTFFVRAGDMLQAGVVFGGTRMGFTVPQFAAMNLLFVAISLVVAGAIFREHKRIAGHA